MPNVASEKGFNADWQYVDTQKGKSDDRGAIMSTGSRGSPLNPLVSKNHEPLQKHEN
jgi:hypothetical protein